MRSSFLITVLIGLFFSCKEEQKTDSSYQNSTLVNSSESVSQVNSGKALSELYCATCHLYPEPALLDKATWREYMLPRMGYVYGIYKDPSERDALFESNAGGERVKQSGLFPDRQTLPDSLWDQIQAYYLDEAPEELTIPKPKEFSTNQLPFKALIPELKVQIPSTTLAQFSKRGTIYIGDANTKSFSEFSSDLKLLRSGTLQEGVVSLSETNQDYWITSMGTFAPTDQALGSIIKLSKTKSGLASQPIKNLQRPVHTSFGDFNQDGLEDLVVSEFGKWTGALSLHLNQGNGQYIKQVLHNEPGAIRTHVLDMNKDGLQDIVALFAQGNEGIDIYYNKGDGTFLRDRVLQFSPSMGSSFIDVIDYNKDGFMDLVLAAGDNADYKPVMKPWHGIYVFTNDGDNNFKESLFLHLNGAYNAVINDFDGDGDQDIAAISFYPDWENTPQEAFVYFEQTTSGNFKNHTFSQVNSGRWIVMDAADFDSDGDLDLVLGSLAFEVIPKNLGFLDKWIAAGIPFLVLENTSK